ncbi:MAG: hypothetical protein A3F72_20940 [Bacteroidetes bacterium RIFCSPLOWO2_12_FULL_35_15]|nr:MAG: hypothetical protein A3F72_20940 [Bacteroidetes bacterium RIFCSPLOWO2_12_FULL_35_15]
MKKITILLLFISLLACNKNTKEETSNTKVLWAENVQSTVPMERNTLWTKEDWETVYNYDKEKIFTSITNAVLSGKLKAYIDYPGTAFSVKEFENILVQWDSAQVEDINNLGTFINASVKSEITSDDIVQLKFNEKIELDTVSYTLNKKVSFVTFVSYKYDNVGEILGLKKLFDVKLNDGTENKKEK